MWKPPASHFSADPLPSINGGWGKPLVPVVEYKPIGWDDIEKKKEFGRQLGKGLEPFKAALIVFSDDVSASLWASRNWLRDAIVVEAQESVENTVNLLDKDAFSMKLLKFADEKNSQGFPVHESKDRISVLKLYAEVQGFIGRVDIDLSKKTFVNNEMKITFVEVEEQKQEKIIEYIEPETLEHENALKVNLKLVG